MPPPSAAPSPTRTHASVSTVPFSPSNYVNTNNGYTQPTPLQSAAGSPSAQINYVAQVMEGLNAPTTGSSVELESPPGDFSTDFDWSFTEDMMGKVSYSLFLSALDASIS